METRAWKHIVLRLLNSEMETHLCLFCRRTVNAIVPNQPNLTNQVSLF